MLTISSYSEMCGVWSVGDIFRHRKESSTANNVTIVGTIQTQTWLLIKEIKIRIVVFKSKNIINTTTNQPIQPYCNLTYSSNLIVDNTYNKETLRTSELKSFHCFLLSPMFVSQLWADQPRSAERIVYSPASKMFASVLLLSIILTGLSCTNLWCGYSQEWNKSFSTVDLMSHNNPHQFSKNQITVLRLMATIVSTNRSVQSDQRGESPVQPHRWCWWDVASKAWRPSPDDQQGVRPALHQTQRPGGAWQLPPRQGGPRQSCRRTPRPLHWRCPGVVHR